MYKKILDANFSLQIKQFNVVVDLMFSFLICKTMWNYVALIFFMGDYPASG
jgi:hypothetical protein